MTTGDIRRWFNQNRSLMMGVAMLMVMIRHHQSLVDFGKTGNQIATYGQWGVDIFIFLSGYGIFHSLNKEDLSFLSVRHFYQRRIGRIFPASLLFGWFLLLVSPEFIPHDALVLSMFGLDKWYIRTILLLYLVSPLLFLLVKSSCRMLWALIVLIGSVAYGVAMCRASFECLNPGEHFHLFMTVVVTILKFPAFMLGMLVYCFLRQERKISLMSLGAGVMAAACLLVIMGFAATKSSSVAYCCNNFLLAFLALPLFGVVNFLFTRLLPVRLKDALMWVGCYSLEIYMVHEYVYYKGGEIFSTCSAARVVVVLVCSFVSAYLLKHLATLFEKGIRYGWHSLLRKG